MINENAIQGWLSYRQEHGLFSSDEAGIYMPVWSLSSEPGTCRNHSAPHAWCEECAHHRLDLQVGAPAHYLPDARADR